MTPLIGSFFWLVLSHVAFGVLVGALLVGEFAPAAADLAWSVARISGAAALIGLAGFLLSFMLWVVMSAIRDGER